MCRGVFEIAALQEKKSTSASSASSLPVNRFVSMNSEYLAVFFWLLLATFGEKGQEGEVFVSFTPTQIGQYQVSVALTGENLPGSPFNLEVVNQLVYRGDYSQVDGQTASRFGSEGQFSSLPSVATNSRREMAIADSRSHCIQVFDRNGQFMLSLAHKDMPMANLSILMVCLSTKKTTKSWSLTPPITAFKSLARRGTFFLVLDRQV